MHFSEVSLGVARIIISQGIKCKKMFVLEPHLEILFSCFLFTLVAVYNVGPRCKVSKRNQLLTPTASCQLLALKILGRFKVRVLLSRTVELIKTVLSTPCVGE